MRSIRRKAVSAAILAVAIKATWGCGPIGSAGSPHPQSVAVEDRIAGIRLAVARNDMAAIPHLVDRLDDEDVAVRWAAILALEGLTDHRFGYRCGASAEDRAPATARWRQFLRENRVDNRTPSAADPGSES